MKQAFRILEGLIFPALCAFCKSKSETAKELCNICARLLPWSEDRCFRCGRRLDARRLSVHCERCWMNPPAFDRLFSLFDYEQPVTSLISGLKFNHQLAYGKLFGEVLSEKISNWYKNPQDLPEAIIPVPLHAKRLRKRGFNQSLELLRPCRKLSIPILDSVCVRTRATRPQSGLKGEHRLSNVRNAFEIVKPIPFQHVAILDDVVTTGSTVHFLSKSLKQAGVEWIDVWCICKV